MAFKHISLLQQSIQPGHSLTGLLLVASPALGDTPFARTVIYVCAHAHEGGAMGLVVNRRLPKPGLNDVLEQLEIGPIPPLRRIGVCAGGPVDETRGFVLHSSDWKSEGSLSVTGGVTLTASLDVLKDIAEGSGPEDALLAMGHASWGTGQLEEEIFRHDAWLLAPPSREIVFGQDYGAKWRQALAAIDIDPVRLTGQTGHA
ncbi:YqgE/AlgH family protein [Acetobacter tropicalis]|nr:YqgE/AlgH family protein [Acetobacter tropicalis]KXV50890.1 transcriptional regulator [Acetobacter tropicalis]